ncbi:hypothetical protein [Anaerobaca lacustris]|uniref:Uncharacterized protein n=1 Tax=Anaerobaca lacustris TaxID=3044600 RepID=A0AAW6TQE0_9BACT|nr:hypothetical protein [Sedimentisphaerales bacterium M17dextr]
MRGQRVHIRDRRDRLACGRRDTGQRTIELDRAEACGDLCDKCRQQIYWLGTLRRIAAEPKRGQLWFDFAKE